MSRALTRREFAIAALAAASAPRLADALPHLGIAAPRRHGLMG